MAKAYVLILNESGTEDSVISNLNNIPSITNAFGTFGTYDILTKLELVLCNVRDLKYKSSPN